MSDPVYCYPPDFIVLRNKLDIRDPDTLDKAERLHVRNRAEQGIPTGNFDLAHLKAIHGHLFQDVYDWAGQVRTVEISKDGSQFQTVRFIETGMADIHKRIVVARCFRGLGGDEFAKQVGLVMGDVNYVHPFREGNGRTQLQYLKQLAGEAGHSLDLEKIDRARWMDASRQAQAADYAPMSQSIREALSAERDRAKGRGHDRGGERER
jgi:cell filamentation protein